MRAVFTQEELNEIRHLQNNLDIRVKNENDIPMDANLSIEKFLALKTELFELANEIESFKYWKKNKNKTNMTNKSIIIILLALLPWAASGQSRKDSISIVGSVADQII